MYKAETRGISVTVEPRFVEEESSPGENRYFFAYTVEIVNNGAEQVQLRSRHWRIIDGRGACQEVRGAGVVGEQPKIKPGEAFQYSSGVALKTPSGVMTGHYEMQIENGERFTIEIPMFSLDSPLQVNKPN